MRSDSASLIRTGAVWPGQIARFAVVGVAATLTHVCVALMVTAMTGLPPLLANLAGFSVAVLVSFWGHLRVTFRVPDPQPQHLVRFIILSLVSLAVSSMITAICTRAGGGMGLAMGLVTLIVPGASFLAARLWAFTTVTALQNGVSR